MILLPIRLKQISRELINAGLLLLPLLLVIVLLLVISYSLHKDFSTSIYLLAALFALCLGIQLHRPDKTFVYRHVYRPRLEIFWEYFALTFPFATPVLLFGHWYFFFLFQIALALVPFITIKFPTQNLYYQPLLKFINPSSFEFLSGLRQSFSYIGPLWLLALALAWVKVLPLVLLWLICTSVATFFGECEPIHILRSKPSSPDLFLKSKIRRHTKYLLVFCVPILAINTFFHPGMWLVNFLFLLVQMSMLVFAIAYKYSSYKPNEDVSKNIIVLSLVSAGSVFPFFLPVPMIMAIVYFPKAIKNLKRFL